MPEQSNDYRVAVFGAGGVGKSSLVLRFVRGTFRENYVPTIEDTYRQVISGKGNDKHVCTLQITDTTGSHQFPAMQRLNISQGHAFILVFSITNRQSLEELKPIYQEICQIKGDISNVPVMLAGNKCDEAEGGRDVTTKEAEAVAKAWKCGYMETSAKTNHNVQELFQDLMRSDKTRGTGAALPGDKKGGKGGGSASKVKADSAAAKSGQGQKAAGKGGKPAGDAAASDAGKKGDKKSAATAGSGSAANTNGQAAGGKCLVM